MLSWEIIKSLLKILCFLTFLPVFSQCWNYGPQQQNMSGMTQNLPKHTCLNTRNYVHFAFTARKAVLRTDENLWIHRIFCESSADLSRKDWMIAGFRLSKTRNFEQCIVWWVIIHRKNYLILIGRDCEFICSFRGNSVIREKLQISLEGKNL